METHILGITGRKQAGKNTVANFIIGLNLSALGIVRSKWKINNEGQLEIGDLLGDTRFEGVFDLGRQNDMMQSFRKDYTDDFIRLYSFADLLKKNVCIDIFGLTYEQCYGTDADKKTLTKLRWEDMPGILTVIPSGDNIMTMPVSGRMGIYHNRVISYGADGVPYNEATPLGIYHEPGFMSAREVLQYVGTEIFRKMYTQVWAESLMRKIEKDKAQFAIIADLRFPNEVEAVKNAGGKVIRLTRNPYNDQHDSETALDPENYDWKNFDYVVDNEHMTIPEQSETVYNSLRGIGWLPPIEELETA
jgi:hypothetical protein